MADIRLPRQEFIECEANQQAMNTVREIMAKGAMFCKEFKIVQGNSFPNQPRDCAIKPKAIMLFEEFQVPLIKNKEI